MLSNRIQKLKEHFAVHRCSSYFPQILMDVLFSLGVTSIRARSRSPGACQTLQRKQFLHSLVNGYKYFFTNFTQIILLRYFTHWDNTKALSDTFQYSLHMETYCNVYNIILFVATTLGVSCSIAVVRLRAAVNTLIPVVFCVHLYHLASYSVFDVVHYSLSQPCCPTTGFSFTKTELRYSVISASLYDCVPPSGCQHPLLLTTTQNV